MIVGAPSAVAALSPAADVAMRRRFRIEAGVGVFCHDVFETTADAPAELLAALAELDDEATRLAITVERGVLEGLDAGCQAPMAAHAVVMGESVRVRTVVYAPEGERRIGLDVTERLRRGYIRLNGSGNGADAADGADPNHAAREIGLSVARRLLDQGAAGLVSREQS